MQGRCELPDGAWRELVALNSHRCGVEKPALVQVELVQEKVVGVNGGGRVQPDLV